MKNKIILIFTTIFVMTNLNAIKCFADEDESLENNSNISEKLDIDLSNLNVDDTFKSHTNNDYKVSQVNGSNITINGTVKDIYNFEIYTQNNNQDTWRKFVKLKELCSDKMICNQIEDREDIVLVRTNKLDKKILNSDSKKLDVYYRTAYYRDKKQFESVLVIDEQLYKFNMDADKDSKFNEQGILTSDVETLTDKNGDVYVSLRFVTEALGAEVKWTAAKDGSKDTVDISFYDDESYCKNINTSFSKSCENVDKETLDKIKSCSSNDSECQSDRCKTYIRDNLKNDNLDNLSLNIDYNYIDDKNNLKKFQADWKKKDIYLSTNSNVDGYGLILYKSVPILIDIFNGIDNDKCTNTLSTEQMKCLSAGNKWTTDDVMIKASGGSKAYCAINLNEQITISASR